MLKSLRLLFIAISSLVVDALAVEAPRTAQTQGADHALPAPRSRQRAGYNGQ